MHHAILINYCLLCEFQLLRFVSYRLFRSASAFDNGSVQDFRIQFNKNENMKIDTFLKKEMNYFDTSQYSINRGALLLVTRNF